MSIRRIALIVGAIIVLIAGGLIAYVFRPPEAASGPLEAVPLALPTTAPTLAAPTAVPTAAQDAPTIAPVAT